jgi:hypothetical protein
VAHARGRRKNRGRSPGEDAAGLAFPGAHPLSEHVRDALVRVGAAQTLVDLYDGWLKLRLSRASASAERAAEAERLTLRAEYVLKSVANARQVGVREDGAPAERLKRRARAVERSDPFAEFVSAAQAELLAARDALRARGLREERLFERELASVKAKLRARVQANLERSRPTVRAEVRPVGRDRSLVHVARPGDDEAVLLYYVLSGRLFTRYDAFFDDSVDDLSLGPARFYPDEGNECARFPSPDAEDAFCDDPRHLFLPVKGMMPFRIPGHDFPRFRLVNRGPMAEVEARSGPDPYTHLMPRAAAELLSGYLIRLKVERRLEVVLQVT